jgi:predicted GNAT family N-acyltransferase
VIAVREVSFGSTEYSRMLVFRAKHLREPLGLELRSADCAGEDSQFHFGAFSGEDLVGCVVLKPISRRIIKLRQMAVSPAVRRSGIGSNLIVHAETKARDEGFETLEMSARVSAIPFYEALGYRSEGATFLEVTIPHVVMRKRL